MGDFALGWVEFLGGKEALRMAFIDWAGWYVRVTFKVTYVHTTCIILRNSLNRHLLSVEK